MTDYNKNASEYGGYTAREFNPEAKKNTFDGNKYAEQSLPSSEYGDYEKTVAKSSPEKKKRKFDIKMFGGFVAAAVVGVAGVSSIASVDLDASIVESAGLYDSVTYEIVLEGGEEAEAVLYNDFTSRTVTLNEGNNVGAFENLKPGLKYTLAVVQKQTLGKKTLTEKTVYTAKEKPYEPVTEWYGVEHYCSCNIDGAFHFTMYFKDERNYYSDFSATLTDEEGNVAVCKFTDELSEEQAIDIINETYLMGNTATLVISCTSTESGSPQKKELYRAEVRI